MEGGGVDSRGSRRSREASTSRRSSSKNEGGFIGAEEWREGRVAKASRLALAFGIERLSGKLAIGFFQENFNAALGFLELFLAFAREGYSFFEELHGVVGRDLRTLEGPVDCFEGREGSGETGLLWRFGLIGGSGVNAYALRP